METLGETAWDVVISGTGLPQALLALSLSRSGKNVLHVDRHAYYGGDDAALNLPEAELWVKEVNAGESSQFSNAQIVREPTDSTSEAPQPMRQPRSYALSLSPQFIYAQSRFLQTLISSYIHTQLEFLAVGSWWIYTNGNLQKIPSGREDVFADESLSMRDKRALMKFLRYVMQESESQDPETESDHDESLGSMLSGKFNLPASLHGPILALSLTPSSSWSTKSSFGMSRIKRHMLSIGTFGPGFGAIIPKFGGNAEITQIGCRAGAVGGGVYVLGQAIKGVETLQTENQEQKRTPNEAIRMEIEFSGGEKVRTRYVVGTIDDLPRDRSQGTVPHLSSLVQSVHSISIISRPLLHIFPPISENGPPPAAALVLVIDKQDSPTGNTEQEGIPVYLQVHSDETGECLNGQCVIYASTLFVNDASKARLDDAVTKLLATIKNENPPKILWSLSYLSKTRPLDSGGVPPFESDRSGHILSFPPHTMDLAFDDGILDSVKAVWKKILGDEVEDDDFMRFDNREAGGDE